MSALLDSLASAFQGDASHKAALDAALRDGLPGPRSEAWKYTSLRALERRAFAPARNATADIDASLLADIPAPRLVFVNGRHAAAHSDIAGLPSGVALRVRADANDYDLDASRYTRNDEVFARLNTALADTGAILRVESSVVVDAPLHLVFVGAHAATDAAWHLHHVVELGDGASLTLVEHHLADGEHRHLDNSRLTLRLGANAQLQHARVQRNADGATSFLRTEAALAASSSYQRLDLELGGARLAANGVLLADGRRHLDTRLGIEHIARDTACDLLWRGIGAGRGRAVFHGGITIHEGADGSDANLSNKNLLLSDTAEVDSQPVLVIHADEVKAAHGATVGQLDPDALFYLRSRGLAPDEARRMLTTAFVRAPLTIVALALREALQGQLDIALQAQVAA